MSYVGHSIQGAANCCILGHFRVVDFGRWALCCWQVRSISSETRTPPSRCFGLALENSSRAFCFLPPLKSLRQWPGRSAEFRYRAESEQPMDRRIRAKPGHLAFGVLPCPCLTLAHGVSKRQLPAQKFEGLLVPEALQGLRARIDAGSRSARVSSIRPARNISIERASSASRSKRREGFKPI